MKREEWERYLRQAEHTFTSAQRDKEAGDYDWACFKAHQAAELVIKGRIRSSDRFITGHSLLQLLDYLQQDTAVPNEIYKCARQLDKVYIPSRYPDAYDAGAPMDFYDREDASQSIACVQKIFIFVKALASHEG